jgi:hypothetical protein
MNANEVEASGKIRRLILECLPPGVGENPAIFGSGGILDSLGLVNFLTDLEYKIFSEFGREVVLASEKAMSRSRSPFRDAASLEEFVGELLKA